MASETLNANNVIKIDEDPLKSIKVDKLLDLQLDLGTLLALDTNDLDAKKIKSKKKNEYLKNLARDNTQLLLNAIWELPIEKVEDSIVAKLPKPTYVLPREKPIPKPKPPTKWEQFAKEKGIEKKKKSNLTWDEILKKWVPRFGYKKAKAEKEKNWIIEVPASVDPYTDMFEKKANIKAENVSKNEFQRMRNVAKAKKIKVPSMGLPPTEKLSAKQLNTAAHVAHSSTASLGKFQPKLSKEKHLNNASVLQKKKRKLPPLTLADEHSRNLKIVDSILNKKPKLDLDKAVNREIFQQESAVASQKKEKRKGGKKGERKPKGGRGKPQFKKGQSGRKRR